MDGKILNQVAKGIQAAERVRGALNAGEASRSRQLAGQERISMLTGTLSAVAEFYPGSSGRQFAEALEKSSIYCGQYRAAKNHFRGMRSGEKGSVDILQTIRVLAPILGSQRSATINKVLMLAEMLNLQDSGDSQDEQEPEELQEPGEFQEAQESQDFRKTTT